MTDTENPVLPYPHPIIAREGWAFLFVFLLATLLCQWLHWGMAAALFGLAFLFSLQFFRDPARVVAGADAYAITAPADGRVIAVEECDDPWLSRRALKISVFMNVFNVHSNRSPLDGEVRQVFYHPGRFFNAALAKASLENERCATHFVSADGRDVVCVQVAGLIARRILNNARIGKRFTRGERFGFIRFGSRVDTYLPLDAVTRVTIGDKVLAASTLLAELSRPARA
ncbi:MAG: phosphatidylserine decarboxylase [Zoogloeaceae bacterium]|jgi:phosphatidylserine decarboxylase|nr:phosphatidylserine decarboxylase [Zoogloeaceae bacterium]